MSFTAKGRDLVSTPPPLWLFSLAQGCRMPSGQAGVCGAQAGDRGVQAGGHVMYADWLYQANFSFW